MGAIKYSTYMLVDKAHPLLEMSIRAAVEAMEDRDDVEMIIADNSPAFAKKMQDESLVVDPKKLPIEDVRVKYSVYDMEMDTINRWGVGVWSVRGKYFCPLEQFSLCHPHKFRYCDELFDRGYDIVGAENHIVFDIIQKITYKNHPGNALGFHAGFSFPTYHHSNSAIPLEWLRRNNYEGGIKVGMFSKTPVVAEPVWIQASMDKMKFGLFAEVNNDAWKLCWEMRDNVNPALHEKVDIDYTKLLEELE